ncbi:hypothetical protein LOK49_LG11G01984 [Camellia lanceoleosa]|uniref:Uncharacterized protein n=1 Tax=Camellia lanceoleosa TaxID=1840588 RepID=A0ACC0G1I4_9ERIC|nr:hypothetical protein LOK49_LG11G01984 [Camellia lanceoleosa]
MVDPISAGVQYDKIKNLLCALWTCSLDLLKVSPWHDIPLHLGDGVFNFNVEIPKETSAKMEVVTDESYTPINQDTKKGKLRYYSYNINWNYGLFPQTREDPSFANSEVEGALGDNDPVDVEIGQTRGKIGQIMKVKPLAALAMLDEGELDWKIVAISLDDPRASLVNDIDDVEKHLPFLKKQGFNEQFRGGASLDCLFAIFLDEDDVAKYTIKTIDDPRTLNKTLYLRPPQNILSQRELVDKWERLRGKKLQKLCISEEDFLTSIKGMDYGSLVAASHCYHIFYEGCLTNFEIGEEGEEGSNLYPEVDYTRMDTHLKRYL